MYAKNRKSQANGMKQLIKGALIGAICGVAAPVGLAVANEVLFAHNKYNDVTAARICFAERTWSLFRLDIKYAKGCKNGLLDSVPLCLVIGVLGGSLLGALSLVSKNTAQKTTDKPAPSATAPQEPVAASIPEQTSDPVETSLKDSPIPSLPSIDPQVSQGLQQLKEINWNKIGKGAAIVGVVAILGVGTTQLIGIVSNTGTSINPFRQKTQRQYSVITGLMTHPLLTYHKEDRHINCLEQVDNAVSQATFDLILSEGGEVVTQGSESSLNVKWGAWDDKCFYRTYIVKQ